MSTKSKILQGAEDLIFKYGIKNITMDDIARHLSMSKKTIYKFYKEKDEIVHSLMQLSIQNDKCRFKKVYDSSENVVAEVFEMMKEMRDIFSKINPIVFHELSKYYPETWKEFQKFKSGFIQEMLEISLTKGIKDGYIRKDINVKLMAQLRVENIEMTLNGVFSIHDKNSMIEVQLGITEHFLYGVCTLKGHKLINKYKNIEEE
ncbi:MAG: TetR/AcrR family transcriptional regulator [Bacteroidota bacterium]|nr:TetR/AcrR family transcriptional regulator [Bacteroidota bacterium]